MFSDDHWKHLQTYFSGTSSFIRAMNRGLGQRIFKSAFVIARGREREQMLCSFNNACHALCGCRTLPFCYPRLCGTQALLRACVSQKRYICANLNQVTEDPDHCCHECDNKLPATSHLTLTPQWGGSVCVCFVSCVLFRELDLITLFNLFLC